MEEELIIQELHDRSDSVFVGISQMSDNIPGHGDFISENPSTEENCCKSEDALCLFLYGVRYHLLLIPSRTTCQIKDFLTLKTA